MDRILSYEDCANGVLLAKQNHSPMVYLHYHPQYEIYFSHHAVEQEIKIANCRFVVEEPCVVITPPYYLHSMASVQVGVPFIRSVTYFDRDLLDQAGEGMLPDGFSAREAFLFRLNAREAEQLLAVSRCLLEHSDWYSPTERRLHTLLFLNMLFRICPRERRELLLGGKTSYISEVMCFISQHMDEDLRAEELARRFAISRSKLDKDFKKSTGVTLQDFRDLCRLNEAKALLRLRPEMKVCDVIANCGFRNSNYFYLFFKKRIGVSPLEYREGSKKKITDMKVKKVTTDMEKQETERLVLAKDGAFLYDIVVPVWSADRRVADHVETFRRRVSERCGAAPTMRCADWCKPEREIQICCEGAREEAREVKQAGLPWFGCRIKVVGEKLALVTYSRTFVGVALDRLFDLLTFESDGSVTIDRSTDVFCDVTGITELYPKYGEGHGISDWYKSSNGDWEITFCKDWVNEGDLMSDYLTTLGAAGWTVERQNQIGACRFATVTRGEWVLSLAHYPAEKTMQIVASAKRELPPEDEISPERVTDTTLVHPDIDGKGLQFIVQLQNGKFVVVDSGFPDRGIEDRLMDYLAEHAPAGQKPTIAAWFITHAHMDHIAAANQFLEKYHDRVELETVAYNFPDYEYLRSQGWMKGEAPYLVFVGDFTKDSDRFEQLVQEHYPDVHHWKIRSGQRWQCGDFVVEILHSHEDVPDKSTLNSSNHMSSAFRFLFGDRSLLVLGDCEVCCCEHMARVYGSALKCTMLQPSHHGLNGAVREIYECADPEIVFWPCSAWWFDQPMVKGEVHGYEFNRVLRDDKIRVRTHYNSSETTVFTMNRSSDKA